MPRASIGEQSKISGEVIECMGFRLSSKFADLGRADSWAAVRILLEWEYH